MNGFVEFEYETLGGIMLEIEGEKEGSKVHFKARDCETKRSVKKSELAEYDLNIIEDIITNEANEWEAESDFYNRYDD